MKNLLNPIVEATQEMLVRYVYNCALVNRDLAPV